MCEFGQITNAVPPFQQEMWESGLRNWVLPCHLIFSMTEVFEVVKRDNQWERRPKKFLMALKLTFKTHKEKKDTQETHNADSYNTFEELEGEVWFY